MYTGPRRDPAREFSLCGLAAHQARARRLRRGARERVAREEAADDLRQLDGVVLPRKRERV